MRVKPWQRYISMILIVSMVMLNVPAFAFASSEEQNPVSNGTVTAPEGGLTDEERKEALSNLNDSMVIESESGESYTTFDIGKGEKAKIFFSYPVRYENEEGELELIDSQLQHITADKTLGGKTLEGYSYENTNGIYKQYIPEKISAATPLIMENKNYTITMAPQVKKLENVEIQKEEIETASTLVVEKDIKASYDSGKEDVRFEYVSLNEGVKENIVLDSKPSSNVFEFVLTFDGMTYRKNPTDEGITLYDENTGLIVAGIDAPYMNDATGKAYSEDAVYSIEQIEGTNQYLLTLTVSEEYLNDEERVYPVTIDPTVSWVGSSKVQDAYVISGYSGTNFYSDGVKKMVSGYGTDGVHRTFIKFTDLRTTVLHYEVTSASFDVYETGNANSQHNVRLYRVGESWTLSSLNWSNQPEYTTYIDTVFTTTEVYNKLSFDVKEFVQGLADGDKNYGVMLRSKAESKISYAEFFGSRTTATSYRPKLTVTYRDLPSQPTAVTASKSIYGGSESVTVSWEGISCYDLAKVQYRVATTDADFNVVDSQYVSYTKIATTKSGTATIPNSSSFPDGYYRVYIRGVSELGSSGTPKSCKVTIDRTAPKVSLAISSSYRKSDLTWSSSSSDCTGAEIYLDGSKYKTMSGKSGSLEIPYTNLTGGNTYTVKARTKDAAGNYSSYVSKTFTVPLPDTTAPTMSASLTFGNDPISKDIWYNYAEGNVNVNYSGLSDVGWGIDVDSIKCYIYKDDNKTEAIKTFTSSNPVLQDGSYSGSFAVPIESNSLTGGTYTFKVEAKDFAGNAVYEEVDFKNDCEAPTATITVDAPLTESGTPQVNSTAEITVTQSDSHSGLKNYGLKLYKGTADDKEESSYDIGEGTSANDVLTHDFAGYEPGYYTLELETFDNVGNSSKIYKDIVVYDNVAAPVIKSIKNGKNNTIIVHWKIEDNSETKYDLIKYSLDEGNNWETINLEGNLEGTFEIPFDEECNQKILWIKSRMDLGVESDVTTSTFDVDFKAPQVEILDLSQGILRGTCSDNNLLIWKVEIKEKDSDDSTYETLGYGTNNVTNGFLDVVDLSGAEYLVDTEYTVRLTATDKAGNTSSDTIDVLKNSEYACVAVSHPQQRILRQNGQSYDTNVFHIGTYENTFSLNNDDTLDSVSWFVNNERVYTGKEYTADVTGLANDQKVKIAALGKDSSGNTYLSNRIYRSAVTVSENTGGIFALPEDTVSFVLNAPLTVTINETEYPVTYMIAETDYVITPGQAVYFADVFDKLCMDSVTIECSVADYDGELPSIELSVNADILQAEYFAISQAQDYYVDHMVKSHMLNGKVYLTWEGEAELPQNMYYQIHKGSKADFIPTEKTLCGDNISTNYWCDIERDFTDDTYYKICVVMKDGDATSRSAYSEALKVDKYTNADVLKLLGTKGYLAYADIATPTGSGSIEKSQGNFSYWQSDFSLSIGESSIDFTRVYNSDAEDSSSMGSGWSHNYDMSIYSAKNLAAAEEDNLILKDADGSFIIYTNRGKSEINSAVDIYKADLNRATVIEKYYEPLDDGTKYVYRDTEGELYHFDETGTLIYIADGNGKKVSFEYDNVTGVIKKVTTASGAEVTFESTVENGIAKITKANLPNGQTFEYSYQGDNLVEVKHIPVGVTEPRSFNYGYTADGKMKFLTDAIGKQYDIAYDAGGSGRVIAFSYPKTNNVVESIMLVYSADAQATLTYKKVGNEIVKTERDTFDEQGRRIKYELNPDTDVNPYWAEYTYSGNLLETETEYLTKSVLDKASGIISTQQLILKRTCTYDDDDMLTEEKVVETEQASTVGTTETTETDLVILSATMEYSDSPTYPESAYTPNVGPLPTSYTEVSGSTKTNDEIYEYDGFGNVTKIENKLEKTGVNYYYEYEKGGKPDIQGAVAREEHYVLINGAEKVTSKTTYFYYVTYSNGQRTEKQVTVENGTHTTTIVAYDQSGLITASSVTMGSTGSASTVSESEEEISTESESYSTYSYDAFGRIAGITTTVSGQGEETVTKTETKVYDANGTLISETDGNGLTKTYTYDALNRLTSTTESIGGITRTTTKDYSYGDVSVNVGKSSPVTYQNVLITTEQVNGTEIRKTYQDGRGRVVREVVNGVATDYSYDSKENKLTEVTATAAGGNRITYHIYDEKGNETYTVKNASYNSTEDKYMTDEDSVLLETEYDAAGNVSKSVDGMGNATEFGYDEQGRITSVKLPDIATTTFAYEEVAVTEGIVNSKVTMTAANNAVSEEISDSSGNVIRTTDKGINDEPINKDFEYDARGNVTKETHGEGDYITYEYDNLSRIISKHQYDKTGNEVYRTEYTYYDNDLVKEMTDYKVSGSEETVYSYVYYEYDGFGRKILACEADHVLTEAERADNAIIYTYNADDSIAEISYGNALGTEVDAIKYEYENAKPKKIKVVIGSNEYVAKEYSYNVDGTVHTVKDYYNFKGSSSSYILLTYTYDALGRIIDMNYTRDNEVVERYTYEYDKNDRIVTEHIINNYTEVDELRTYYYDSVGNILIFDVLGTTELNITYSYDEVGNRVTKEVDNGEYFECIDYMYNGLNQLTEETYAESGAWVFYEYDLNGNQTSRYDLMSEDSADYTYTPSGMLESYTHNNDIQANLYNGEGKRVSKVETVGEATDATRYYYQDGSVLRTTDAEGTMKSFNLLNISDVFATSRDNTLGDKYYFYTEDIRGSKTNLIDSNASNVVSYWYSDFGEVTEVKGTNYSDFVNEIQYTGAIYDKFSGLTYLNARFYDASTGRFISQDSYRGERNDADTWHLYLYCANDPINYVDPSGNLKIKTWMVSIPIDVLCITFGSGWKIFANFQEIKRALTFTKKLTTNKILKVLPRLRSLHKLGKSYEEMLNGIGTGFVKTILKGMQINAKRANKLAKFITESARSLINTFSKDKIMSKVLKKLIMFTSVGSFIAGVLDVTFDETWDEIIFEI